MKEKEIIERLQKENEELRALLKKYSSALDNVLKRHELKVKTIDEYENKWRDCNGKDTS